MSQFDPRLFAYVRGTPTQQKTQELSRQVALIQRTLGVAANNAVAVAVPAAVQQSVAAPTGQTGLKFAYGTGSVFVGASTTAQISTTVTGLSNVLIGWVNVLPSSGGTGVSVAGEAMLGNSATAIVNNGATAQTFGIEWGAFGT